MSQSYTWPAISVAAPVGGATSANQVIEIGLLTSIDGKTPALGQATMANSSPVVIASNQSAIAVTLAVAPLPTNAATASNQTDGSQKSQIVDGSGNVWGPRTGVSSVNYMPVINLEAGTPGSAIALRSLQVAGSDGTNLRTLSTDAAGVLNVAAASLPLPSGAATSALQTAGNASLSSIDSKLTAPLSVTGPLTDTQLRATPVPISAASLPLPSGAATSALQTTGNSSLSSIDGKLNSLGQKTSANSVPVVLASDQSAVSVNATPVSTSGTLTQAAKTVGTSAVRCTVSGSAPSASRKALIVEPDPTSTAKFYVGSSSVASSGANRGISLAPGAQFIADFDASDFYIISDTAAQTFFVVEEV